jgi:uncharacterized protein YceH (UPF0502 family)
VLKLDRTERRVIGALIEKRWSTPEQYPLTLNYLLGAANQKSNRDPAMSLKDFEVKGCLLSLREKGHVLVRERDGGRVTRYAEKLTDDLLLPVKEAAVLAELLLRGPQSPQELARRASRMVNFEGLPQAEEALRGLAEKHLVRIMPRESGRRYLRWNHRLYPEDEQPAVAEPEPVAEPIPVAPQIPTPPPPPTPDLRQELDALRGEVEDLKR